MRDLIEGLGKFAELMLAIIVGFSMFFMEIKALILIFKFIFF